ncbi:MAG: transcriptional regulator NrdR [Vulcanimicrobiota bacterium]
MRCPFCKNRDTKVIDTRMIEEGDAVRRRRKCIECKSRFTTYERYSGTTFMVVKRNHRREPFHRDKIIKGISIACSKRDINPAEIERIVNLIEERIKANPRSEIKAQVIGDIVMQELKKLDNTAYLRFVSVYKDFDNPSEFIAEAESLNIT